jgi:hypothetical protein
MATITNASKIYSAYAAGTTYAAGNVVSYLNQLYVCILASTGNVPTNATYWSPLLTNSAKT